MDSAEILLLKGSEESVVLLNVRIRMLSVSREGIWKFT